jgi:hypothetical protein
MQHSKEELAQLGLKNATVSSSGDISGIESESQGQIFERRKLGPGDTYTYNDNSAATKAALLTGRPVMATVRKTHS